MAEQLRYFLDEHMRPAIARQLRLRGVDVQTTVEAGRAHMGLLDDSQLAYMPAYNSSLPVGANLFHAQLQLPGV